MYVNYVYSYKEQEFVIHREEEEENYCLKLNE